MGRTPSTDELVPELTFDEIDRAFDNNEFCFYLQPKCNVATGAIVGAEALVRWNHPKYGVVSPGRFVPMLEQAGQSPDWTCSYGVPWSGCWHVGNVRAAIWCRFP